MANGDSLVGIAGGYFLERISCDLIKLSEFDAVELTGRDVAGAGRVDVAGKFGKSFVEGVERSFVGRVNSFGSYPVSISNSLLMVVVSTAGSVI